MPEKSLSQQDRHSEHWIKFNASTLASMQFGKQYYMGNCGYIINPKSLAKVRDHLLNLAAQDGMRNVDVALLQTPGLSLYLMRKPAIKMLEGTTLIHWWGQGKGRKGERLLANAEGGIGVWDWESPER